jgi:hypothetical protein
MGMRGRPPLSKTWPSWMDGPAMLIYLEQMVSGIRLTLSDGERLLLHTQARTLGLVTSAGFLTPGGYQFLRNGPEVATGESEEAGGDDSVPVVVHRLDKRLLSEIVKPWDAGDESPILRGPG